jgi:hypothetical protein
MSIIVPFKPNQIPNPTDPMADAREAKPMPSTALFMMAGAAMEKSGRLAELLGQTQGIGVSTTEEK